MTKRAPSGSATRYDPQPGEQHNGWTIVSVVGRTPKGTLIVEARCECGKRGEKVYSQLKNGESQCCGCRGRKKRRKGKNGGFYLGAEPMHRDADGSGPRLVHGAAPTPGGTVLTPEVVAFMRRHGVTRVEAEELEP